MKREQPGFGEEGIWPALMVGAADAPPGALFLLAQDGAQSSPDKPVEFAEGGVMGMFEVAEPAAQQRVEIRHGGLCEVAFCDARTDAPETAHSPRDSAGCITDFIIASD